MEKTIEKYKIIIMTLIGISVLIGVIFYILGSASLDLGDIILVIIPIILVIGTMIIIWDKIKNIRAGLPSEDERAKKLNWKAGAYSYFATIWIAVGIMWYNIIAENTNFPILNVMQVIAAIILLSAICFFIFNFYFMRKGDI
jgi:hypothetical protein